MNAKELSVSLLALADKAIWAAAAGNATDLQPNDVRMLREAAKAASTLAAAASLSNAVRAFADNPEMSDRLRETLYINGIAKPCDVEPYLAMCEACDEFQQALAEPTR